MDSSHRAVHHSNTVSVIWDLPTVISSIHSSDTLFYRSTQPPSSYLMSGWHRATDKTEHHMLCKCARPASRSLLFFNVCHKQAFSLVSLLMLHEGGRLKFELWRPQCTSCVPTAWNQGLSCTEMNTVKVLPTFFNHFFSLWLAVHFLGQILHCAFNLFQAHKSHMICCVNTPTPPGLSKVLATVNVREIFEKLICKIEHIWERQVKWPEFRGGKKF